MVITGDFNIKQVNDIIVFNNMPYSIDAVVNKLSTSLDSESINEFLDRVYKNFLTEVPTSTAKALRDNFGNI